MGGFFKKLFKDSYKICKKKDDLSLINNLVNEIITEEEQILNKPFAEMNKPPDIAENITFEIPRDFKSYSFYLFSHKGIIKESNQDSIFTAYYKYQTNGKIIDLVIGIVADGMGGLSMGETASITAITAVSTFLSARIAEYFQEGIPSMERILTQIKNAMQNANAIVKDKGQEFGEDIGTTFTLVFIIDNIAYFGHVGDSRAYIIDIQKNTIEKVTEDHSLVGRLVKMGELTEKEAKSHPRRNEIYRMLGLRNAIEVDTYCKVIDKNSIIVLLSDGLWELVEDNDILSEIAKSSNLNKSLERLTEMANNKGGYDNISIVAIKPES